MSSCNTAEEVELCLNAEDLSAKESCTLNADSFTIEEITTAEIFNEASQLFDDLNIDSISEGIAEFKKDEAPEGGQ